MNKSLALAVSLLIIGTILLCSSGQAQAQEATVTLTDPTGDTSANAGCAGNFPPPSPDITSMTATKSGNNVIFTITFLEPSPSFSGFIFLDIDQSRNTGYSFFTNICIFDTVRWQPDIGVEYGILFSKVTNVAGASLWRATADNIFVPTSIRFPSTYTEGSITITVNLSRLQNDDGNLDFAATIANGYQDRDVVPNTGHGTLGGDTTPPDITITSPQDGATFTIADDINIIFSVTDPESGVTNLTATIDGNTVTSGTVIPASTLGVGTHTLTITATNGVGLNSTKQATFDISVTVDGLTALTDELYNSGFITSAGIRDAMIEKLSAINISLSSGNFIAALNQIDVLFQFIQQAQFNKFINSIVSDLFSIPLFILRLDIIGQFPTLFQQEDKGNKERRRANTKI